MSTEFKSPITMAKKLIKENQLTSTPIDVDMLCRKENIQVRYINFGEIEDLVKKKISGAIQKSPDGRVTILVNEKDIETRARFTIAHELGHYYLHMDDCDAGKLITSFRMDQSPTETQANQFAAELLMPEELLKEEYRKMIIPVSDSLAKIFNVSKQAMKVRLDSLELMYV